MIGFDLSDITNVYVGSTPQSAIYLGSILIWPKQFKSEYLTFELLEPSQFGVITDANYDYGNCYVAYSIDNGLTWHNVLSDVTPVFPAGTKVIWKGNLSNLPQQQWPLYQGGSIEFDQKLYVNTSGRFKLSGNPASLYFEDQFANNNTQYEEMYKGLFMWCDKLVSAKDLILPTIITKQGLCRNMFGSCQLLTEPPTLSATQLAPYCYQEMFSGCTSLTTAPVLPATILENGCYYHMFASCTSLTTAPVLPARTIVGQCYDEMFYGCTSLNAITCYATDISNGTMSNPGHINNWVYNVAPTGVFTKPAGMTDWIIDSADGIPVGWTVQNIQDYSSQEFTIISLENYNTIQIIDEGMENSTYIEYNVNGTGWQRIDTTSHANQRTVYNIGTINANDYVKFRHNGALSEYVYDPDFDESILKHLHFNGTKTFNACGNVMSLLFGSNYLNQTNTTYAHALYGLFCNGLSILGLQFPGVTNLIDASNLILPATTLTDICYQDMFFMCKLMTAAPALPATTLGYGCYINMFLECSSLTTAPELPATTLTEGCYATMFSGCSSLTTAPSILPATTLTNTCYSGMFQNCSSLTTAPELPATILTFESYASMFNGCTSLNSITCLATDISASICTNAWVFDVAASGTFTKAASMTNWTTGADGIPSGWTVQDAS